jgi:hypothetical protein
LAAVSYRWVLLPGNEKGNAHKKEHTHFAQQGWYQLMGEKKIQKNKRSA